MILQDPQSKFFKFGKISALTKVRDVLRYRMPFNVTEKIDGGNCQIRNMGGRIVAGSRANYLHGSKIKSRPWFEKLNGWMHSNGSLYCLPSNLVMFGEWTGNHTIDYQTNNDQFFLLDLFDINTQTSMPYEDATEKVSELGIGGVRFLDILFKGHVSQDKLEELLNSPSSLYSGPREGLVLRNYELNKRLKIYHPDFADKVTLDNGKTDYLTPARFRKAILYLVDETKKNAISPAELVDRVRNDISSEENISLDFIDVAERFRKHYSEGKLLGASKYLVNV